MMLFSKIKIKKCRFFVGEFLVSAASVRSFWTDFEDRESLEVLCCISCENQPLDGVSYSNVSVLVDMEALQRFDVSFEVSLMFWTQHVQSDISRLCWFRLHFC